MNNSFIIQSAVLQEKFELMERFVDSKMPILIIGEAGVGKRAFAKETRARVRPDAPFVEINCAFLKDDGGPEARFKEGARGTVFLNGVDVLGNAQQKETLACIEKAPESTLILASSAADVEQLALDGHFRKDFSAKLCSLPVYLPPLRQRPDDIKALAAQFLRTFSYAYKRRFEKFSDAAEKRLLQYRWPGNIRELKNCVEFACMNAAPDAKVIDRHLLRMGALVDSGAKQLDVHSTLKTALDSFKTEFIIRVLEAHGGNQSASARSLDIQRTYLSALIRKFIRYNASKETLARINLG